MGFDVILMFVFSRDFVYCGFGMRWRGMSWSYSSFRVVETFRGEDKKERRGRLGDSVEE